MAWRDSPRHRNWGPVEARPGSALEPLSKLARELEANVPPLQGRVVETVWTVGGPPSIEVAHGLGRVYQGAILLGQSTLSSTVIAYLPDAVGPESPATNIRVALVGGPAVDLVARWWVF